MVAVLGVADLESIIWVKQTSNLPLRWTHV